MTPSPPDEREAIVPYERYAVCAGCGGLGYNIAYETRAICCQGSDWECGASGCTGPVEEWIEIQIECECQYIGHHLSEQGEGYE